MKLCASLVVDALQVFACLNFCPTLVGISWEGLYNSGCMISTRRGFILLAVTVLSDQIAGGTCAAAWVPLVLNVNFGKLGHSLTHTGLCFRTPLFLYISGRLALFVPNGVYESLSLRLYAWDGPWLRLLICACKYSRGHRVADNGCLRMSHRTDSCAASLNKLSPARRQDVYKHNEVAWPRSLSRAWCRGFGGTNNRGAWHLQQMCRALIFCT